MRSLIIIPARYGSTRFEGKPLALLGGRPIIEHVWRRATTISDNVIIATDDERIRTVAEQFGATVIMTSPNHVSGSDRCAEAYSTWRASLSEQTSRSGDVDVVVNLQGDEPFIEADMVEALLSLFKKENIDIATLAVPFENDATYEEIESPNSVKVVLASDQSALYFSRCAMPYQRGTEKNNWARSHQYLKHIGIYAFRPDALRKITTLPPSPLEIAESLEQLRWLENGCKIGVNIVNHVSIGIDTLDDLKRAEIHLLSQCNK